MSVRLRRIAHPHPSAVSYDISGAGRGHDGSALWLSCDVTGTLAYLAPEATGRTGRPVDQRADLYSAGAVLYELATGEPSFGSGDRCG